MLDFLTTPSWTALFNVFALSIVFLIIYASVISITNKESKKAAIAATGLFVLSQVALKIILIIGVFSLASGVTTPLLLLLGYLVVLLIDVPTIALAVFKKFTHRYNQWIEQISLENPAGKNPDKDNS